MSENKEAFLSRWSRLKLETPKQETQDAAKPAEPVSVAAPLPPTADLVSTPENPLPPPPLESITVQSDFSPYLQATVDAGLKRMALKKLFQDPHFHFANMDKLDIYIGDYSIADPLPEGMLEQLKFAQDYIFKDPAKPEVDPTVLAENVTVMTEAAETAGNGDPQHELVDIATESADKMSHLPAIASDGDEDE